MVSSRRAWGPQSSLFAEAFPPRDIRSLSKSHSAAAAPGSVSREFIYLSLLPGPERHGPPQLAWIGQFRTGWACAVWKRQALL